MYSVFDDKGYMSTKFNTIKEVNECAEDWRDNYMGNGVDFDSYVSIVEWIDEDEFVEIKRWNIEVDEQQHKDFGHPSEQGCEYEFWAKWTEPYESERYKELWVNAVADIWNSLGTVYAISNNLAEKLSNKPDN